MSKDLNQLFEELLNRYIKSLEKKYQSRLKRARDKELIREEIIKEVKLIIELETLDTNKKLVSDQFMYKYKQGEEIQNIIKYIRKTYGEDVDDIKPYALIENGTRKTFPISEDEKELKAFALNDRKLIKFLIRHLAFSLVLKQLPEILKDDVAETKKKEKKQSITWTGSEKNKNEFVQLIYALYQAGFINKGKGEITKITEDLAETFGLDLGKNWQSNHSASIHKAKSTYQPPIFDKIKKAYLSYSENLIEDKRKNK